MAAAALHREQRGCAELCSLWQWQGPREQHELCQGKVRWGWGKGSSPEGDQALAQTPQGSSHSPRLMQFKKHLDSTFRHWPSILGRHVWSQDLDLMVLVGPSNLGYSTIQLCFGKKAKLTLTWELFLNGMKNGTFKVLTLWTVTHRKLRLHVEAGPTPHIWLT